MDRRQKEIDDAVELEHYLVKMLDVEGVRLSETFTKVVNKCHRECSKYSWFLLGLVTMVGVTAYQSKEYGMLPYFAVGVCVGLFIYRICSLLSIMSTMMDKLRDDSFSED